MRSTGSTAALAFTLLSSAAAAASAGVAGMSAAGGGGARSPSTPLGGRGTSSYAATVAPDTFTSNSPPPEPPGAMLSCRAKCGSLGVAGVRPRAAPPPATPPAQSSTAVTPLLSPFTRRGEVGAARARGSRVPAAAAAAACVLAARVAVRDGAEVGLAIGVGMPVTCTTCPARGPAVGIMGGGGPFLWVPGAGPVGVRWCKGVEGVR